MCAKEVVCVVDTSGIVHDTGGGRRTVHVPEENKRERHETDIATVHSKKV